MTTLNEFIAGPLRAEISDAEGARRFLEEMTRAGLGQLPDDVPDEIGFCAGAVDGVTPEVGALLRDRVEECVDIIGALYLEAMRAHVRVHGITSAFYFRGGRGRGRVGGWRITVWRVRADEIVPGGGLAYYMTKREAERAVIRWARQNALKRGAERPTPERIEIETQLDLIVELANAARGRLAGESTYRTPAAWRETAPDSHADPHEDGEKTAQAIDK